MKFLKTIFGRLLIVGLAIILQFLVIFSFIVYINKYFWVFNLLSTLLGLVVFFQLLHRDMYPEPKLTWLAVILLMPLFGTVLYLMFSYNPLPRKQKKLFCQAKKQADKLFIDRKDINIEAPYKGQSNYIKSTNGLPCYENCICEYFSSGEGFWSALKEELNKAEKFIFMEYFIIECGVMWNDILDILQDKVKNGVEVRIIYDDIGSIGTLPSSYCNTLKKLGIKCVKFNPFYAVVSGIHNNRDHRKITVIDGKVGFIGGANLADEYINKVSPYGHWKDSALMLKGEAVKSLSVMFLTSYQMQTGKEEIFDNYITESYESFENNGYIHPYCDGPAPAYKDHVGENVYINLINSAQKYLYITTPYLIIDHEMQSALRSASLRGVDVRIITPHIPDKKIVFNVTRSNYKPLMDYGIKIYEYTPGFVHAKNFLSDGKVGVVGTINLDYRSLTHHYECAVWMCNVSALEALKDDFDNTFTKCCLQDEKSVKMGVMQRFICNIVRIFTPLF